MSSYDIAHIEKMLVPPKAIEAKEREIAEVQQAQALDQMRRLRAALVELHGCERDDGGLCWCGDVACLHDPKSESGRRGRARCDPLNELLRQTEWAAK